MKLKLNKDYCMRHLFVTVLMTALCGWFAFDGFIRYPSMDAIELYRSIEGPESTPPEGLNLDGFKQQKIKTQYGFSFITLIMAMIVGLRLWHSSRFDFSYDKTSFVWNGLAFQFSDIKAVDKSRWDSKTIVKLNLESGESIVLDGWHHVGVKEFVALIDGRTTSAASAS